MAELIEPVEVLVDEELNSALTMGPSRTSLPSMFPPGEVDVIAWVTWAWVTCTLPAASSGMTSRAPIANRPTMAPRTAYPCLRSLAILPNVHARANGMASSNQFDSMLVRPVGFSKGWPALALNGPPPLVPNCLIASWEAIGPPGIPWDWPETVVSMWAACRFCSAPWAIRITAAMAAMGRRTRTTIRVRSAQKFPRVFDCLRVRPRMSATATAIPTAADTKFCTASPAIWVNWDIVSSPA